MGEERERERESPVTQNHPVIEPLQFGGGLSLRW